MEGITPKEWGTHENHQLPVLDPGRLQQVTSHIGFEIVTGGLAPQEQPIMTEENQ